MHRFITAGLAAIAILCFAGMAAQAAETPSALSLSVQSLLDYAVTGFATLVVAFVATAAKKLFGLELDKSHRDTLHSALRTGAGLALSLIGDLVSKGMSPSQARSVAINEGVTYVKGAAADALKHFGLQDSDGQLFDMLKSTATQLQATTPPVVLDMGSAPVVPPAN